MSQVSEKTDDRLEKIFQLQKGLSEMMNLDRYPKDPEGRVSALSTAIMHEAVELQRTTNWKWWKTPTEFNEAEAREEEMSREEGETTAALGKNAEKTLIEEAGDPNPNGARKEESETRVLVSALLQAPVLLLHHLLRRLPLLAKLSGVDLFHLFIMKILRHS